MSEYKEEICRKLRLTAKEFGQDKIKNAVIIGTADLDQIGGHKYIYAPTVTTTTLGLCEFKVARFFEDF